MPASKAPPKKIRHLRLTEFIPTGAALHFARTRVDSPGPFHWHTHDYDEIFLIESGSGLHHINGKTVPLAAGHLVFMRDRDRHTFSGSGLGIANLSFPSRLRAGIAERHFDGSQAFYGQGALPRMHGFDEAERRPLAKRMESLAHHAHPAFALELFLMQLFSASHPEWNPAPAAPVPTWLSKLTKALAKPEQFRDGPRALFERSGHSPAHVARSMRKYLGKTPTEVVNEARLDWAAGRLASSDAAILDISLDCGFESLAYFYKIFERRYGVSPKRYRLSARRILGMA